MPKLIETTVINVQQCVDCGLYITHRSKSEETESVLLSTGYEKVSSDLYHMRHPEPITKTDCPRCEAKAQNAPVQ